MNALKILSDTYHQSENSKYPSAKHVKEQVHKQVQEAITKLDLSE